MLKVQAPVLAMSMPIVETRSFSWNIENVLSRSMSFQYHVGEGPLYWFRVDWYTGSPCPPNPCVSSTPMISYIAPNCPYEIIDNCLILPPPSCCNIPSCTPGSCTTIKHEVWHMLATSVTHLCERINQECCNRVPKGFIRRVQQYMRPALCCDVKKLGAKDEYQDVNFINCECGNLVDPCIAMVVYPCYVNRCGINGPAFTGGDLPPISTIKFAPDLLDFSPIAFSSEVSAMPMAIEAIPPSKETEPVTKIFNRFGPAIPELLHCKHNLTETNVLGEYLKSNEIDLFHDRDVWRGSKIIKDWKIAVEWRPSEEGYKFNLSVDRTLKGKTLRTKAAFAVKDQISLDHKGNYVLNCSINISTGTLIKGLLQSKLINDDIGLFKKGNKLNLNLKG